MNKQDRRQKQLLEILKEHNYISIGELAGRLGVSEMTIRRDVRRLRQDNLADNIGGRMVYIPWQNAPVGERRYELADEMGKQNAEKERIGRYAASMVAPGDTIVVDTGTTTERVIPYLAAKELTVLCYNINILLELQRKPDVKMMFAGGYYYPDTQMFSSAQGLSFIQGIRTQKAFVSAAGIHGQMGVTCMNSYEAPAKKAILSNTLEKILVADSSKFGRVRSAYFCELGELDHVVTDAGLPEEWRDLLEKTGVRLHLV